jgi:hypothetical protein
MGRAHDGRVCVFDVEPAQIICIPTVKLLGHVRVGQVHAHGIRQSMRESWGNVSRSSETQIQLIVTITTIPC